MNEYDDQAQDAIEDYHKRHGSYPRYVEVTAKYREKMSQDYIECVEPIGTREERCTRVGVVPLGTCDIVYRGLFLQSADINLEQAKCKTQEKFHRLGAKFARAGCLLLEPKSNWGQQSYPPFLFYARIEVFVFGEQGAFDIVMAEGYNQLPGD